MSSSKLRQTALDSLARREHSKFELKNKLLAKGFIDSDIEEILQELAAKGLQSDARFVEAYVAMRSRRGFGPQRIRGELRERGINQELSDQFLDERDSSWFELIIAVREKKYGAEVPKDLGDKSKQMKYLYYKGFNSDHIKNIFKSN